MHVLSVGEILWDVFPEKELLGGAPLNFCANSVRLGDQATLISAVGRDERGKLALERVEELGIDCQFVQQTEEFATGVALVGSSSEGEPRFSIPRPAAFDAVNLSAAELQRVQTLRPDWLYFGTLFQVQLQPETLTQQLAEAVPTMRRFYDMNLRTGAWNLSLVQRLCRLAHVLKLNEFEAQTLAASFGMGPQTFSVEDFCKQWGAEFGLEAICVTLGEAGCLIYQHGETHTVPGYPTVIADTVGAGDAFAAAFLYGFHRQWPVLRVARFANALGSILASRRGATPEWSLQECLELAGISPDEFRNA